MQLLQDEATRVTEIDRLDKEIASVVNDAKQKFKKLWQAEGRPHLHKEAKKRGKTKQWAEVVEITYRASAESLYVARAAKALTDERRKLLIQGLTRGEVSTIEHAHDNYLASLRDAQHALASLNFDTNIFISI